MKQAEIDVGKAVGATTTDTQKIADLELEVQELQRATESLNTASDCAPPRNKAAR